MATAGADGDHARDSVDRILADWAEQRPELDFSPVGIVTRLARVRGHLDYALAETFASFDLSPADFAVIVTLRRAGPPYRLPQVRLMTDLGLTSGTVSVRATRLERMGIVRREDDPDNRRIRAVELTDAGLELFDRIAPVHLAGEDRLLAALSSGEREQLAGLLRKLLVSYEHTGRAAARLWGMRLDPAHVARRNRADVGLADPAGLLVREVAPHSPADEADLKPGDLVVSADDKDLRTVDDLARSPTPGRALTLTVLRGERRLELSIDPPP